MNLKNTLKNFGNNEQKNERSADYGKCAAHNCPCAGAINDSGGWLCRFHYGLDVQVWTRMTNRLNECLSVLMMTRWIRDDSSAYAHDQVLARIKESHFVASNPKLAPLDGETPGLWSVRAEGWISAPIHKNIAC